MKVGNYEIEQTQYDDQLWIRAKGNLLHLLITNDGEIAITRWNKTVKHVKV